MAAAAEQLLDVTRMGRRVWVARLPADVAHAWREACDGASEREGGDDTVDPPALGTLRVQAAGAVPGAPTLTIALPSGEALCLAATGGGTTDGGADGGTTVAVSYSPEHTPRVEGRAAATWVARRHGGARGRGAATTGPKNAARVRVYEPSRDDYLALLAQQRAQRVATRQRLHEDREAQRDGRLRAPPRADRDALERELFGLFESRPGWTLAQLQATTQQPAGHLRTVLGGIAALRAAGPLRGQYTLRPEYLPDGMRVPTATDAAAGAPRPRPATSP